MTNLKEVTEGYNKFCGPAVLSILTGRNTDDCARAISKINGDYRVVGVLLSDLLKAAKNLGFDSQIEAANGSFYRTLTTIIHREGTYIVAVPNHFVCIEIKDKQVYFCDNHTKTPIPAASSARLGQVVAAIYRVWKNEAFVEAPPKPPVVYIASEEYVQVVNLCHAARFHKKHCIEPDCNVSLYILKQTVYRLFTFLTGVERDECQKLINETEWS